MNLIQILESWKNDPNVMDYVTCWQKIPARPAVYASWPEDMHPKLSDMLQKRGIRLPYSHQAEAFRLISGGKDTVIVTPTASGKSLCYQVPVLDAILKDKDARALFLFPTKALSADQVTELYSMITALDCDIKAYTYDGDTSVSARKAVRSAGNIVVTNPDMLHSGILPNHVKWVKLFENLRYVVIDEIHTYRGIFGSHLTNVIRRLKRICQFYGSDPVFVCCSATIANPLQLAETITGRRMSVVDKSGAPYGERDMIFYNPPVVNKQLGIRKSALTQARMFASVLIANHVQTIVFARSRLMVEVLLTYLKAIVRDPLGGSERVRGYRGGYMPLERRAIEKGLKNGSVTGVVSTNALELGVDIGSLEACVLCGYPGTIASTWQQAGRAGRRNSSSVTLFIANSSPMDQFIVTHPEYFFEQSPEMALVNPDNLYIFMSHLKCAAFELPFEDGEEFGNVATTEEALSYLQEEGILQHVAGRWHWSSETFPAADISLRSASNENVIIVDTTGNDNRVIGEMDHFTAPMLLHDEAIYIHEGVQYQVEKLDLPMHKAFIKRTNVDYYTDADMQVDVKVMDVFDEEEEGDRVDMFGEVLVNSLVTVFKKIKFDTHENIGWGQIHLPEMTMHTQAVWYSWPKGLPGMNEGQIGRALSGVTNLLANVAPLFLMCDPRDIVTFYQVRQPFTNAPTLFLYDAIPGSMGLSEKMFHMKDEVFRQALSMLDTCPCETGCPSCVGPDSEPDSKELTRRLLLSILDKSEAVE
ncbi:MAG: DEAD/DEAH box helicase [Clostridia bacterium]|nr:DEAD/DEAH box helicase [Clostridia bacterium]